MRPAENGEALSDAKRAIQRGAKARGSTRGEDAARLVRRPAAVSPLRERAFAGADRRAEAKRAR